MAFTKTKQEIRDYIQSPIKQATVIAVIALCVAALALIVAAGGNRHGA
jgi:Flp pilus assembly CpaF family ATPase